MPPRRKPRDFRGSQARIGRLAGFHLEGFIHVLAYRIMVILTILYGIFIVIFLAAPGLGTPLKIVTGIVWVLWTPQLFEVAKGLALAWSRGMAYGKLNPEFAHLYRTRYNKKPGLLRAFPWVVLAVWAAAFVALMARWHP